MPTLLSAFSYVINTYLLREVNNREAREEAIRSTVDKTDLNTFNVCRVVEQTKLDS
jgi:hypothetical protein